MSRHVGCWLPAWQLGDTLAGLLPYYRWQCGGSLPPVCHLRLGPTALLRTEHLHSRCRQPATENGTAAPLSSASCRVVDPCDTLAGWACCMESQRSQRSCSIGPMTGRGMGCLCHIVDPAPSTYESYRAQGGGSYKHIHMTRQLSLPCWPGLHKARPARRAKSEPNGVQLQVMPPACLYLA